MCCMVVCVVVVFVWCLVSIVCVVITLAVCTGDTAQSYAVTCRVLGWEEGAKFLFTHLVV